MKARTSMFRIVATATLLCLGMMSVPTMASESARVLNVPPGPKPTKAAGSVQGKNDVVYRIKAKAGQQLAVSMWSERPTTYFNIERADSGEAIFVGQNAAAPAFDQPVPAAGSYLIRVYQMGAAASGNKRTKYELNVMIENRASAGSGAGGAAASAGAAITPMEYGINRMSNGNFEIVFSDRGCIATANRRGEILSFNERCTDDLTARAREIARREK